MTCELGDLDSDIAFPARSLAKQVVDNVLCVSGRDAAAGEEGKQAVCRVAVTGDIVDKNRLVGNAEEVLLGLDDKHGIDGAQVFFGIGKRGVGRRWWRSAYTASRDRGGRCGRAANRSPSRAR